MDTMGDVSLSKLGVKVRVCGACGWSVGMRAWAHTVHVHTHV